MIYIQILKLETIKDLDIINNKILYLSRAIVKERDDQIKVPANYKGTRHEDKVISDHLIASDICDTEIEAEKQMQERLNKYIESIRTIQPVEEV